MVTKADKLTVTGRVQGVGYRRYILDLAQEKGLAGYVRNEKDGSVTIFVQGERKLVSSFEASALKPPPPTLVKDIRKSSSRPYPGLKHFSIKFGSVSEELQEGFGAMQTEFRDYREEFRDYRNEFRDYREEFRGFASRTDDNFKELGKRYGDTSDKLSTILETLQKESAETRKEMTGAVDNLAKLVDQCIKLQTGKP